MEETSVTVLKTTNESQTLLSFISFFCKLYRLEKKPQHLFFPFFFSFGADRSHLTWELPKTRVAMVTSRCRACL